MTQSGSPAIAAAPLAETLGAPVPGLTDANFNHKSDAPARERVEQFQHDFNQLLDRVSNVVVGLKDEAKLVAASVFTGGHVLIEGTPGLAKTLMIRTIATALGLEFKRISFTPDMMPADITGSLVQRADRTFEFRKGPVFTNILLADEINRTIPKTQAALLESMQERQVSYDGKTYELPKPFLVLATQNPLESQGTYDLPDAQLDRFAIKINVEDPKFNEMKEILRRTTGSFTPEIEPIYSAADASRIIEEHRELVKSVAISDEALDLVSQVVVALNPRLPASERIVVEDVGSYVWSGSSPRGGQSAIMLAKVFALMEGRGMVIKEDIEKALVPALSHRVVLRPESMDETISAEGIIKSVLEAVEKA